MSHVLLTPMRLRVVLASLVAIAIVTTPAAMASDATRPARSGWWWAAQTSSDISLPVPYGTEPGDILVSRHAGAEEKAAAVWIDVADLDTAPRLLLVKLDELDGGLAPLSSGALLACPVINRPWEPVQGGAWPSRPAAACTDGLTTAASRDAAGTWTFDLTPMATAWTIRALPNLGFEIVPARSLRYPSFEIGLQAPGPDDVYILAGSAATSPAPTPTELGDPASAAAPAGGGGETGPNQPGHKRQDLPLAAPSLPRRSMSGRDDATLAGGPTAPATTVRSPSDSGYERTSLVGTIAHLRPEPSNTPIAPALLILTACAGTALWWSRRRAAAPSRSAVSHP